MYGYDNIAREGGPAITGPGSPSIRSAEALGRALRTSRERRGLTQAELAIKSRTTRQSILNIEAGHETQALRAIFEALSALGLELTIRERDRGGQPGH